MDETKQDQNFATDKVLAFDTIFTTNHIKMLKVLTACLEPPLQKFLAVYIKFSELQFTINYLNGKASPYPGNDNSNINNISNILCNEIIPYCTTDEKKTFEKLNRMLQMVTGFKEISGIINTVNELFPEGMEDLNLDSFETNPQIFDILTSLMSINDT